MFLFLVAPGNNAIPSFWGWKSERRASRSAHHYASRFLAAAFTFRVRSIIPPHHFLNGVVHMLLRELQAMVESSFRVFPDFSKLPETFPDLQRFSIACDPVGAPTTSAGKALRVSPVDRPGAPPRVCPRGRGRTHLKTAVLSVDAGEITDKDYVNQRAVLERRAAWVVKLYATPLPEEVIPLIIS
jgi:hypothetical protein